ncbi:MAG: glycosyltransferase [Micrococcales bacterium]
MKLSVVIPVYNEAAGIGPTLSALLNQSDTDFDVVFCDNNSTDGTGDLIREFAATHALDWVVVEESRKGTGAAADTACRAAIARGATHLARTDADCVPAPNWVEAIKSLFDRGFEFISGWSEARRDDPPISQARVRQLAAATELAVLFGKVRPSNRGHEFKGPYQMTSGNNMAISSALYEQVGGFTRTAIEEVHEDRELINAVRRVTNRYVFSRRVLVYASARRVQAWGLVATLEWYRRHRRPAGTVDVR